MIYVGIDPGKAGALAMLDQYGQLVQALVVPTIGKDYDLNGMVAPLLYRAGEIRAAALEHVGAMPGQGVTSMFSFGRGLGLWEGALAALEIPYELVKPGRWMSIVGGLPKDKAERKARLVRAAGSRWPTAPLARKKDWGIADALWIAEWARRQDLALEQGSREAALEERGEVRP